MPLHGMARRCAAAGAVGTHQLPAVGVGQRMEELEGADMREGLHAAAARQVRAAREQMHLRCALLQRAGRRVERRGARAQHGHALAGEIRQWRMGVRVQRGGQRGVHLRGNARRAAAVDARGQHQFARDFGHRGAIGPAQRQLQAPARQRFDVQQLRVVAHLGARGLAVPAQIVGPGQARNALQRGVGGRALRGLVPSLETQRGNAGFRAGQRLGGAQRGHARDGGPHAFAALGRLVDGGDTAHARAAQAQAYGQAALAAADDEHVMVGAGAGRHPVRGHIAQPLQGATHFSGQRLFRRVHATCCAAACRASRRLAPARSSGSRLLPYSVASTRGSKPRNRKLLTPAS